MKTNIALIGFMGVGKTAVGKVLAAKSGRRFIEMDRLIEQKAGKPIPEIFQQDGEIAFRQLEIEVAREVAAAENAVIACGGGIVLNQINIDRLKQNSIIVYLTASPAVILKRVSGDSTTRPLLNVANPMLTIRELLKYRYPFYQQAADFRINTSKLDVNAVAGLIITRIRENEGLDP